jgi:predicted Rossmann fold nucleotide-binding protein DprA/Smf involved in DNA uptake
MGDVAIHRNRFLGLVCSVQCPGSAILKTFDAVRLLRDAGVPVIGGFHSPMERECLDLLLRGHQPVVLCPARGLTGLRLGRAARHALADGRLLILSPFGGNARRTTVARAVQRNGVVAALADVLLVPHAAPGGKTWTAVRAALGRHQPVLTFDTKGNAALLAAGARPFTGAAATAVVRPVGHSPTPAAGRW